jgi:hypothetical protein
LPHQRRANRRSLSCLAVSVVLITGLAAGCARQNDSVSVELAALSGPLTGVLTQHNDLGRTGANLNETVLTTSNVNTSTFGKLTSLAVSGQVYAQPLYVASAINGKNVVFIATEANKVYAYDADSPWELIWSRTDFEAPWASTACVNTQPMLGISSTPVIDPASNTIYVVDKTNTGTTFKTMLHVLNMTTGADKVTPVDVSKAADGTTVSVNGTGDGSVSGKLTFDPMRHQNRVGLTLSQGVLSIGFASHCDQNNYHGWLLRFDTTVSPPRPLAPYVTNPNTGHGGFWMGGQGFSVDANGDLYFMSGDGRSGTTTTDGTQLANAFVRLTNVGISGTPTVATWFMPSDVAALDTADSDIGSSGPLLIPGSPLLVGGGKNGIFYVLNRTTMGGFVSGSPPETQIVQRFSASSNNGQIVGSPVWWESPAGPRLYVWPGKAPLAAFAFNHSTNLFNTTAVAHGVDNPTTDPQGGQLSLSANGSTAGTGILWGTHPLASTGGGAAVAGVLYAYNAENVAQKLWDSSMRSGDGMASATKYVPPTVANGKVYIATFSDKVEVYGLFAGSGPPDAGVADAGGSDAGPLPMITCGTVDGGAPQPTNWSYVFSTYFAGTVTGATAGHCQECHTTTEGGFTCGADKDSCYAGLVASGKVTPDAGTSSPIGDPNQSMLAWFDNPVNPPGVLAFMPSDLAVRNARAAAAVCGWVAAGARDDKGTGQACAGNYECASNSCVAGLCGPTLCVTDADCIASEYCLAATCVPRHANGTSCSASDQCLSNGCCSSVCDDISTDFNNCGACGNVCLAGSSCTSSACTAGCSTTNGLIDNFDDGNNVIRPLENRTGHIYTIADTRGTTITPSVTTTFTGSSPGHSGLGAHFTGHIANLTGTVFAALNVDFKNPRATYNASRYTGFTFWAKKGTSSANGAVRIKVPDHNTDPAGGVCTSCGNDFGTNLTLTTSWTQYTVRFATLAQESGGSPRPPSIDATQLYGIKFQVQAKNANYDVWIDDVTFICN